MNPTQNSRLHNLDYLRGLSALGIMVYHHHLWINGIDQADMALARLGLYGVSVFYVLSGLTLYTVYADKMKPDFQDVKRFAIKRLFRIYPLLWLATLFTLIVSHTAVGLKGLFLNLTGLFGFVAWDHAVATGAWSIGNELVFYVFFIVFFYLLRNSSILFWSMVIIVYAIAGYFAFYKLHLSRELHSQFGTYKMPLNQLFLFISGFLVAHYSRKIKIAPWLSALIIVFTIVVFIFYPVSGDRIKLVAGFNRIVFSALSVLICFGFYKFTYQLPNFLHRPLALLGEISFAVYLMHPIIYRVSTKFFHIQSIVPRVAVSFSVTFIISYLIFKYFEKYFIHLGAKVNDHNSILSTKSYRQGT